MKKFTKNYDSTLFVLWFLLSVLLVLASRTNDYSHWLGLLTGLPMFYYLVKLVKRRDEFSLLFIILTSFFVRAYPLLRTPYLYTNNVWSNAYIIREIVSKGDVPLQVVQHPENAHVSWPFHFFAEATLSLVSGVSPLLVEKWIGAFVGSVSLLFVYLLGSKFYDDKTGLRAAFFFGLLAALYNNINSHTTNIPEFLLVFMFYMSLRKERFSKFVVFVAGLGLMNVHPLTFVFSIFFLGPSIHQDVKRKDWGFLIYLIPLLGSMVVFWFDGPYPFMYKNMKYLLETVGMSCLIPFSEALFVAGFTLLLGGAVFFSWLVSRINLSFGLNHKALLLFFGVVTVFLLAAYFFDLRLVPNYSFRQVPVKYLFPLLLAGFLFLDSLPRFFENKVLFSIIGLFIVFSLVSVFAPFAARLDVVRTVSYALFPASFVIAHSINFEKEWLWVFVLLLVLFCTHPNYVFGVLSQGSEAYGFINSYDVLASDWVGDNLGERRLVMTDTTLSGPVLYYGNRSASWDKSFPALTRNQSYFMDKFMTHINSPAITVNHTLGDDYHLQGSKFLVINDRMRSFGVVHGYGLPSKPLGVDVTDYFLDKVYANSGVSVFSNNKV